MRFKGRAWMKSNPDFTLNVATEPVELSLDAAASFSGKLGHISATIGEVPVRLAIPFLRRRHRLLVIGSIGKFTVTLDPLEFRIDEAKVHAAGVVGTKGLRGSVKGRVGCSTVMNASGIVEGTRLGSVTMHFGGEEMDEEMSEEMRELDEPAEPSSEEEAS